MSRNRDLQPAEVDIAVFELSFECLDGIDRRLEPPDPVDAPYETEAEPLPRSLMEALQALDDSTMFRAVLGDRFIDYILTLKQAEVSRFLATVTDWEHREYFEIF